MGQENCIEFGSSDGGLGSIVMLQFNFDHFYSFEHSDVSTQIHLARDKASRFY